MFQWGLPPAVFLLYRILVALYSTCILFLSILYFDHNRWQHDWLTFLTNWTYFILTCHLVVAAVITVLKTIENGRCCTWRFEQEQETRTIPIYMKISWCLFSIVSSSASVVTIVYFTALYPRVGPGYISEEDINLHLMNSVLVLLEYVISALPLRLLHIIYPELYGLTYVIFSYVYWTFDHSRVLYPGVLDWNYPRKTIIHLFLVAAIGVPALHFFWFTLYQLGLYIHKRCTRRVGL